VVESGSSNRHSCRLPKQVSAMTINKVCVSWFKGRAVPLKPYERWCHMSFAGGQESMRPAGTCVAEQSIWQKKWVTGNYGFHGWRTVCGMRLNDYHMGQTQKYRFFVWDYYDKSKIPLRPNFSTKSHASTSRGSFCEEKFSIAALPQRKGEPVDGWCWWTDSSSDSIDL